MNLTKHTTGLAAALALFLSAAAWTPSYSAVTITAVETGSDVVFTYSGSIDLTNLGSPSPFNNLNSAIVPSAGQFQSIGSTNSPNGNYYTATFTGDAAFGSGFGVSADSSTGDKFGFLKGSNLIALDASYNSNDALNGTITYTGKTFSSLGVTAGTYVYTMTEDNSNTITMNIGSVPEPSRALLAGLGLCGLLLRRRRVRLV